MRIVLYYRHGYEVMLEQEMSCLQDNFFVTDDLQQIQPGDLVLCRFSLMPFARALEAEVESRGGQLIHSAKHHEFLADMRKWLPLLGTLTPKTWFSTESVTGNGPFFVKGITNSIKSDWNSCFAQDLVDLGRVMLVQSQDPLMASQPYAIRQYEQLRSFGRDATTGTPLAEEYRVFVYKGQVLSSGFYWQSHLDQIKQFCKANGIAEPDAKSIPKEFVAKIAKAVQGHVDFFVVDVARTAKGDWTVIELNDATMSGLSGNDPSELYNNLRLGIEQTLSQA